jgi:putative long chain acyl-CoA synthase
MRLGRLGAPYAAPYDIPHRDRVAGLRHYHTAGQPDARLAPVLLIPPLMVTSEVYDIAPELSAVQMLGAAGIDVWLVDFGAPERAEGGMERTLDDHVRAIGSALDFVREATGQKSVHLAGYSQGGMFAYQVAAFRRCEGVASLITFGSPVDIQRSLPGVPAEITKRLIGGLARVLEKPLEAMEGLPGFLTSTAFKLISVRKEAQQLVEFVGNLHDRQALERRESRRRFLGGEGFVAWPGPAFRKFVDEFIVGNRMAQGGFVIEGRTVTLSDLTCPILFFVGTNDEIARAPAVRAIRRAAPQAEQFEVPVRAGHFGLVVGSRAVARTWPTVIDFVKWKGGIIEQPSVLFPEEDQARAQDLEDIDEVEFDDLPLDIDVFYDAVTTGIEAVMRRANDSVEQVTQMIDNLRWQVPRLAKLRAVTPDTRIGMGKALAEQAQAIPDATFFLYKGRAFTYKDANQRVDAVVRGLVHCGVSRGAKVGVLMETRPSYLSIVAAVNRLGAVAVLLSPESTRLTIEQAVGLSNMQFLVTDPDNAAVARAAFKGPVLSLGGFGEKRALPEGVLDMEAIDAESVVLPSGFVPDDARAADLAMIIFTAGRREQPRPARITNRRWAFSALGAAAGCALTSSDTVYCCLPLHHAAGMMVAVGGALVGGSRLALSPGFSVASFASDVHRYGASVVFYAGEMLREVVDAPRGPLDGSLPVRLFAGSGMRLDVWKRLKERFPRANVLEFYASTEGNAVLANPSGKKIGSLGKALPGSADLALLSWGFDAGAEGGAGDFKRDEQGHLMTAGRGEFGVLVARVDASQPMAGFDGYENADDPSARLLRGVFDPGDAWFVTGDLMRSDEDGDYWFVDRVADAVKTERGVVTTLGVEDALMTCPQIARAIAFGVSDGGKRQHLVAGIVLRGALDLEKLSAEIESALPLEKRPRYVRVVPSIPLTDGFRPRKLSIQSLGLGPRGGDVLLALDPKGERYTPQETPAFARA